MSNQEYKIPSDKLIIALEQSKKIREYLDFFDEEINAQMEELVTTLDNESRAGPSCN